MVDRRRRATTFPSTASAAYDKAVQSLVFGGRLPAMKERAASLPPDPGRHRRPQGGAAISCAAPRPRPSCGSAIRAGKPPRGVRERRFQGQYLCLLRRQDPRRQFRGHARRAEGHAGRDIVCCTPAPQPDPASISARPNGPPLRRPWASAAWCLSSTSPIRVSATGSRPTAAPCASSPGPACRCSWRILFPSRSRLYGRARGQPQRGGRDQREGGARAVRRSSAWSRRTYSNPPTHGSKIVATVLARRRELRRHRCGRQELGHMRERIKDMPQTPGGKNPCARCPARISASSRASAGMFSYSGLTKEQVVRMREELRGLCDRKRAAFAWAALRPSDSAG